MFGIIVEESFLTEHLVQAVAFCLIEVLKDGLAKLLNLAYHIPILVVGDIVGDVAHDPTENLVGTTQRLDELVNSQLLHLRVVECHTQIGREVELARQVSQHRLEKGIDGLHSKIVIVVDEMLQGNASLTGGRGGRDVQFAAYLLHVAVAVGQLPPDAIKLAQDAHLHLLGGLVGEGHREGIAIAQGIQNEEFDIFHSQPEGLSTACTCLINGQGFCHKRNDYSFFFFFVCL